MPTDNIIVLHHFFNLTKKSNLIDRFQYDLTQFCDNLVVATFLGHPVYESLHHMGVRVLQYTYS